MKAWDQRHGTGMVLRPATDPASIYAVTTFTRDAIRFDVSAIIKPERDDGHPADDNPAIVGRGE